MHVHVRAYVLAGGPTAASSPCHFLNAVLETALGGQVCWLVWRLSPPQTPVSIVLGLTVAHGDVMGLPLPL